MQILLPPAQNTLPRPDPSDETAILTYMRAEAQQQALTFNAQLATDWNLYFQDWLIPYNAGKLGWDANPQAPPPGFMVEASDPADKQPADFNVQFVQIGPPVCAAPTFQRIPSPNPPFKISIGSQSSGAPGWWNALPDNNVPWNYGTTPIPYTSQDGKTAYWTWIPSPFGGWWKPVN